MIVYSVCGVAFAQRFVTHTALDVLFYVLTAFHPHLQARHDGDEHTRWQHSEYCSVGDVVAVLLGTQYPRSRHVGEGGELL